MRKPKRITPKVAAKRLFELCMEINGTERRQGSSGKPTAFFRFSGHVALVSIEICLNGWTREELMDKQFEMYVDKDYFSLGKYNEIRRELESIRDGLRDNKKGRDVSARDV